MSQKQKIIGHLRSGRTLTPLEALGVYGVFRLAARVNELRAAGYRIRTVRSFDANGKPYARYSRDLDFSDNVPGNRVGAG